MLLPQLQTDNSGSSGLYKMTNRDMVQAFSGYDHNLRVSDGRFFDMGNLTSDLYPVLTQRDKRGTLQSGDEDLVITSPNGICANEKLAWVDGTTMYYDNVATGLTDLSDSEKQLVSIGSKICVFPDAVYYDTADGTNGALGVEHSYTGVSFSMCNAAGTNITYSTTKPANPTDGQYWLDTSSTPNVLKQWSASSSSWVSVPTTYVKISAAGIDTDLADGDAVTFNIEDCPAELAQFNTSMIIRKLSSGYLVVTGIISTQVTGQSLTVTREIPEMSYLVQLNNRIWGCSADGHHLYACALGDPKNWKKFDGIASDSYEVTIGSDGKFTGAAAYRNTIYFFKENRFHKIYGTMPSNFEVTDSIITGVKEGAFRSLAQVESYLYYLSPSGVCLFDGSFATSIGDNFGTVKYSGGVAGSVDYKYYISMQDQSGAWHLFVYDTRKGIWCREDALHVYGFAYNLGELYALTDSRILAMKGTVGAEEADFDWFAESGDIGLDLPDFKYVSRLVLRTKIGEGSVLRVLVSYDDGDYMEVAHNFEKNLRLTQIPIIPQRCDHMRIKLEGRGSFRLYSISKVIEQGSEL